MQLYKLEENTHAQYTPLEKVVRCSSRH